MGHELSRPSGFSISGIVLLPSSIEDIGYFSELKLLLCAITVNKNPQFQLASYLLLTTTILGIH